MRVSWMFLYLIWAGFVLPQVTPFIIIPSSLHVLLRQPPLPFSFPTAPLALALAPPVTANGPGTDRNSPSLRPQWSKWPTGYCSYLHCKYLLLWCLG